jgi:sec-independent protein translocase protein TatA
MAWTDPLQLMIIGIVVVVIFLWGPQKIPELARALGRARKEFEEGTKEIENSIKGTGTEPTPVVPKTGDQMLLDTARQLGISTEGKTREQISQEIVSRAKPQA